MIDSSFGMIDSNFGRVAAPPKPAEIKQTTFVLGTMVVKFDLPMSLVNDINRAYDKSGKNMPDWNDELAGKIKEEKLVNDILTLEIKSTFLKCFQKYLETINMQFWHCFPENAWINEMRAGEYNPMHWHSSKLTDVGLSSVLMLKRPSTYGKEASLEKEPSNGRLGFIGGDQGPVSVPQVRVDAKPGEFYIFPYSLMHEVYPFNGTDEVRRTLSCNCNLFKPGQLAKEVINKLKET